MRENENFVHEKIFMKRRYIEISILLLAFVRITYLLF